MSHPILNIAHRGFSEQFPENTLLAFEEALKLGVDMIELDVQLSQDRQVVVHHDDDLGRTNEGNGHLKDHTLAELKALDAGSWFAPHFSKETIPLLKEVLDLVQDKVWLNIEIKTMAHEAKATPDCIEHQVAQLVKAHGLVKSVLISSFEMNCLRRIKQIANELQVALLDANPLQNLHWVEELQPFSYHASHQTLSSTDVARLHEAQLPLYVFTVNEAKDMERMIQMGVDGIITNCSDLLKDLLQK